METVTTSYQPKKAVIYARVSSKEQEKEGFSIPSQLKLLNQYAIENRLSIVQEYVDVETAKKSGRIGFNDMTRFFKKESRSKSPTPPCQILLVEKTDRLYRNLKDWVTLDDLDLEIHFVKENIVLSRDSRSSEKFMHGIKVLMAKNYIDNLSEETRKGMLEKAEQGIYPSFAPLGYLNVKCGEKRFIQPDPIAGPQVRKLFEWYASANYSILDLTKKAHEEGFRFRKTGAKIPKSVVNKILKNPIYYGSFRWSGRLYSGSHEPLISKELFDKVQEVMADKGKRRTRQQKYDWAFRGLLTCGHCGCALTAEIKKGKYFYYHCTGNKGKCPEKWVREEEIDRQFKQVIAALKMDQEVIDWVVKALKESHQDEKKYHNEQMAELQRQLALIQKRLDHMYTDKLDGLIDQDFYERKRIEWQEEIDDIFHKIDRHTKANRAYFDDGIKLLELSQRAVFLYEKQTLQEKRKILNFVCSNSIWKDGRLTPNYRQPFDIIAESNLAQAQKKTAFNEENGLFDIWLPG